MHYTPSKTMGDKHLGNKISTTETYIFHFIVISSFELDIDSTQI